MKVLAIILAIIQFGVFSAAALSAYAHYKLTGAKEIKHEIIFCAVTSLTSLLYISLLLE